MLEGGQAGQAAGGRAPEGVVLRKGERGAGKQGLQTWGWQDGVGDMTQVGKEGGTDGRTDGRREGRTEGRREGGGRNEGEMTRGRRMVE